MGSNRRHRLRGAAAFAELFQRGRRIDGENLQLLGLAAARPYGRVGYIIARKQLGRAVDRNLLRRLLREAVRRKRPGIELFDIVFRLRRSCPRAAMRSLALEAAVLMDLLVRSGIK